ncbi:hypothetical protein A3J90_08550 [candidate division WOR-1 bacterium RIFOXYC2_FULL_37_10]|uniref:Response regulatory domain-containing protein n=1 Tax=candidate division WOR-1 bacterium RIFOXYB2_FULL_37_13 TaxID=1802579 RepID=A0A1F4SMD5_UNCSA|nr:MAG: hypothetical protein A2246_01635 [candidate division WOR-1 bacterium RIFOXYA2_FULL_37_7]OGC21596.1 MAG: hypothetical protein A2310_02220 [candidate division WOR-1 bacterium RIFOXYB2_FULL_37_13]OGC33026.1 MAG: hypothetical protein A3J90_08550 [candidate division WOR-1 bacterium RIFOXYC2_FULL_37_10]
MLKPLVLVVDDEVDLNNDIVESINKSNKKYEAISAYSAEEALSSLEKHKVCFGLGRNCIRFVVLDIKMPGMNGLELLETLREKYKENIGVVMLTAWEDKEKWDKATAGFVVNYLVKPFDPAKLIEILDRFFEGEEERMIVETFEKHIEKDKKYENPASSS